MERDESETDIALIFRWDCEFRNHPREILVSVKTKSERGNVKREGISSANGLSMSRTTVRCIIWQTTRQEPCAAASRFAFNPIQRGGILEVVSTDSDVRGDKLERNQ